MNATSLTSVSSLASSTIHTGPRRIAGESAQTTAAAGRDVDSVEISKQAQRLSQETDSSPIRLDLVSRVRAEIANGTYENPARLEIAALKLRRDLVRG